MVASRDWREEKNEELMFNGAEFQCYKIRRLLDMDGGDSCTALQMYLLFNTVELYT